MLKKPGVKSEPAEAKRLREIADKKILFSDDLEFLGGLLEKKRLSPERADDILRDKQFRIEDVSRQQPKRTDARVKVNELSNLISVETDEGLSLGDLSYQITKTDLGNQLYIPQIYVQHEHRRCGYGSMLLAKAEQIAKKTGSKCIFLEVDSHNQRGVDFFLHHSFYEVGRSIESNAERIQMRQDIESHR